MFATESYGAGIIIIILVIIFMLATAFLIAIIAFAV